MKIMLLWLKVLLFCIILLLPTIIGGVTETTRILSRQMSMLIFLPIQFLWIPVPFLMFRKSSKDIDEFLKRFER